MARYEHLPIFRAAFDLAVHMEKIVRHFSRYHKFTIGTELRNHSQKVLSQVIVANNTVQREPVLLALRQELEQFKVLSRLCHESGGFASVKSYLFVAERIVDLAKQNEGWLKQTTGQTTTAPVRSARRAVWSGETGYGQNRNG
ncbi:MAG: four helix bundle protein [Magnetococcus sp. YQC-9]